MDRSPSRGVPEITRDDGQEACQSTRGRPPFRPTYIAAPMASSVAASSGSSVQPMVPTRFASVPHFA